MALVRNASILFVCTMLGNVSNYLFQFVMGRSLTLEDFGTMNALLSVMTSITLPAAAIMFVVAKYASTYRALGQDPGVSSLYVRSIVRITAVAALLTTAFILSSGAIKGYLNVPALSPVLILAVGIFSAFVLTVNFGMLQGLQRFYLLGIGIGASGLLRLLLGALFIYAGLRLNGALLATTLPAVIVFVLTIVPLSRYLKGASPEFRHKKILTYSVPVLIASSIFAFLTNVDLMMVKHYLAPDQAGIYASISVLGKTMFYLPSSFALALFPMVSVSDAVDGDSFKILDKALLLTILISVAALLVFAAAPELILTLLFGPRFAAGAPYLKYYGAAMGSMAVLSILISFNLARSRYAFLYSLAAGSVLTVALLSVLHADINQFISTIFCVFLTLAAFNVGLVYRERRFFYRERNLKFYKAAGRPNLEP